mmetsp:Transcript_1888/g.2483  ORF Transcript_1888/g.2483 Transcript_1888/m.2483 type:complete len:244 (+) Transcript_1888:852-1583(+)
MFSNRVLLLPQQCVPFHALFSTCLYFLLPVRKVGLHPLDLPLLRIDILGPDDVPSLEVLESFVSSIGVLNVICVSIVELLFQVFNFVLKIDTQFIDSFQICVSDSFSLSFVCLFRVCYSFRLLSFHGGDDAFHLFGFSRVSSHNHVSLRVELKFQSLQVSLELVFKSSCLAQVKLIKLVHLLHVVSLASLKLLLSIVQVSCQHLDDGILPVHFPLVILCQDLDLFSKLVHFVSPHKCTVNVDK